MQIRCERYRRRFRRVANRSGGPGKSHCSPIPRYAPCQRYFPNYGIDHVRKIPQNRLNWRPNSYQYSSLQVLRHLRTLSWHFPACISPFWYPHYLLHSPKMRSTMLYELQHVPLLELWTSFDLDIPLEALLLRSRASFSLSMSHPQDRMTRLLKLLSFTRHRVQPDFGPHSRC